MQNSLIWIGFFLILGIHIMPNLHLMQINKKGKSEINKSMVVWGMAVVTGTSLMVGKNKYQGQIFVKQRAKNKTCSFAICIFMGKFLIIRNILTYQQSFSVSIIFLPTSMLYLSSLSLKPQQVWLSRINTF